ncbi:hypothetical protein AGMMS49944_03750 [Spirochaetia bacterium]|nr:hypothetical protein AGMMS49944_03750 [Spirochaetia bacterium]
MSESRTLYEALGFCPLFLFLEFKEAGNCMGCPMEDGVDIGVGWQHHCGNECTGSVEPIDLKELPF